MTRYFGQDVCHGALDDAVKVKVRKRVESTSQLQSIFQNPTDTRRRPPMWVPNRDVQPCPNGCTGWPSVRAAICENTWHYCCCAASIERTEDGK